MWCLVRWRLRNRWRKVSESFHAVSVYVDKVVSDAVQSWGHYQYVVYWYGYLTKLGFFSTPWPKTGIFFTPLGHKIGFFYPLGHFFFLRPQTVFTNFTPLRQFFPPILPPSDCFFVNFTPLIQFFSPILPHSDTFFHTFYPPRTFFSIDFTPLRHFFNDFTPLGQFFNNFTPLVQFFLRPSSDKKYQASHWELKKSTLL